MKRAVWRRGALRFLLACAAFFSAAGLAQATIRYKVSLASPEQHLFHVTMDVPAQSAETLVAFPAWNALYQIRDFALRVRDLNAACRSEAASPIVMRPLDKQTWRISSMDSCAPSSAIEIRYSVLWDEPGPFNSQLNAHHAFLNLAQILMYLPDRRSEDASVEFVDLPEGWTSAAELDPGASPGSYAAPSYDALVDAPVEIGKLDEFDFVTDGVTFHVVVDAANWNRNHLEQALRAITAYEFRLMGGPPVFTTSERCFTFLFHVGPYADVSAGGMEHANSTAISAQSAESAAATAAHEFFHVWNVKRIRPQALEPVDYSQEQHTRALWFAEGVTSEYAALTLERTGLWSKKQFFADLAAQISDLQSRPAHLWQSAEESSLDAWFEKYPEYNLPTRSVSYYEKGQILGFLLDLAIRNATGNHKSLDDVVRRMNAEYAGQHKFYNESEGIRSAIEEVAGTDFGDFFRRYVSGTEEIPYNTFLAFAGLELKLDGGNAGRYSVTEVSHTSEPQRRILEGLLRGTTD